MEVVLLSLTAPDTPAALIGAVDAAGVRRHSPERLILLAIHSSPFQTLGACGFCHLKT